MNLRDDVARVVGVGVVLHHPVDRAEQLHPQRRFEPLDELGHALEVAPGLGAVSKERPRLLDGVREQLERGLRAVPAIAETPRVVAFDVAQRLPEIVRVRPEVVSAIGQLQVLACLLEEVGELLS